ncbi:MAG: hypothetical protein QOG13_880 [Sphingomonadales bacterium]|jgi:hypothetical protein|nr:hypothetical protein [Sphingomonadales bacterium]MEA3044861.1 hypothetical protein [Sphingomonadales bacterium]
MVRTFIGGIVGGAILFVTGFIFWATPLGEIPYHHADDTRSAAIQLALNQNLTPTGTGAYIIPSHGTAQGSIAYGQGPIATVYFNTIGYPTEDMSMLLPGFILALVSGLLMAFGLAAVGGGGRSFSSTAQLVVLFSLGFCVWEYLATPVFNHFGWRYWIYAFTAESVSLILAGLVIARWFLPGAPAAAAIPDAPAAPVVSAEAEAAADA